MDQLTTADDDTKPTNVDDTKPTDANIQPEIVIGVAIKTDIQTDANIEIVPDTPDTDKTLMEKDTTKDIKKTFVTKNYILKRKHQTACKFKCRVCKAELSTVSKYNQHYLDNHPPTPCPYCDKLFSSLMTMAKHRYKHSEIMFECDTCGIGFSFKSDYESHQHTHNIYQGYVCFKPKCGQRFK